MDRRCTYVPVECTRVAVDGAARHVVVVARRGATVETEPRRRMLSSDGGVARAARRMAARDRAKPASILPRVTCYTHQATDQCSVILQ